MTSKARELADLGSVTTRLDEVGNTDGALSNRNLIINGAMQVAQRGTSSTSTGYGTVDRFQCVYGGGGTITQSKSALTSSDAPYSEGFRSSFKATVTTPSSSSTSYVELDQSIETQDIVQSGWDYTSANSYLTYSFWAKSSLAGTYYVVFLALGNTADYQSKSFTLGANTWKKVTVTVSGASSLSIDDRADNASGLQLRIIPDYGTAYSGGSEAVENVWYYRTQSNGYVPNFTQDWQNTSGATFEITGVQLEVGDTATPFEHRSYGDELARCQRYYQKSFSHGVTPANGLATGTVVKNLVPFSSTAAYSDGVEFLVEMRAVPTMTSYNTNAHASAGQFAYFNGAWQAATSTSFHNIRTHGFYAECSGSFTAFSPVLGQYAFTADAEL